MRVLVYGYSSGENDVIIDHKEKTIEKASFSSNYDIEVRLYSQFTLEMYVEDLLNIGGYTLLETIK